MLQSLLTHYGYPILFLGTLLEGETILVLAGIAAHLGYLSLEGVILSGLAGTLFGDQLYFLLGRWHGQKWLARHQSWQSRSQQVFAILEKHQNLLIIGFRFMYGLRTITPFVLGISRVSYWRYALLNILGATLWACVIGLAGYYFGRVIEALLGDIKHYEILLMLAVATVGGVVWLVYFIRQRRQ